MSTPWLEKRLREEHGIIRQRIRLALINMALLAIIWVILAGFVYGMEHRQSINLVDRQLQQLSDQFPQHPCLQCPHTLPLEHDPAGANSDVHYLMWASRSYQVTATYQPFPAQTVPYLRQVVLNHNLEATSYYSLEIMGIPYRVMQWPLNKNIVVQLLENIQDDQSRLGRLLSLLIWGGVIGLVLSLIGGFVMGLWTLKPILAMRRREQEFLSDVSHELRTPLAAMTTHAELLIRHANDPIGAHLSWVEAVYNEAHRMSQLVSALLDMSYLDEGDGALNLEPVSLLALGETVDTIYRPVLEESGLTLNVIIPPDAVVLGDALRLRQLLLIFLDNAHKHTKNGTVTLKVVLRGSHAEIHLEDTGEGMPTALVPKATGRFVHGGNSPIGGVSTGLGLAIAKKIVEAHHGRLTIRSVPGVGTDVVVSLRLL
ncbi:MAG: sensor histidine kinase [Sulfobacillus sp.]